MAQNQNPNQNRNEGRTTAQPAERTERKGGQSDFSRGEKTQSPGQGERATGSRRDQNQDIEDNEV